MRLCFLLAVLTVTVGTACGSASEPTTSPTPTPTPLSRRAVLMTPILTLTLTPTLTPTPAPTLTPTPAFTPSREPTPEATATPRPPDWRPPPAATAAPVTTPPTPYPQGRFCTAQPCWETLLDKIFTYCVIQEAADPKLIVRPDWVGEVLTSWGGTTIPPLEPVLDCTNPELTVTIGDPPPGVMVPAMLTEDDWAKCTGSDVEKHSIWLNRDCVMRFHPDMPSPSEPEGMVLMVGGPMSPERLLRHEFGHLAGLPDAPDGTCDLMTHRAPPAPPDDAWPPGPVCPELGAGPDDNMVHAMRERYDWRVMSETIPPPTPPPGCYEWPEGSPISLTSAAYFFCPTYDFISQCEQGTIGDWIPDVLCRLALGQ